MSVAGLAGPWRTPFDGAGAGSVTVALRACRSPRMRRVKTGELHTVQPTERNRGEGMPKLIYPLTEEVWERQQNGRLH